MNFVSVECPVRLRRTALARLPDMESRGSAMRGCTVKVRALVLDRLQGPRLRVSRPGVAPTPSMVHVQRIRRARFGFDALE